MRGGTNYLREGAASLASGRRSCSVPLPSCAATDCSALCCRRWFPACNTAANGYAFFECRTSKHTP